MCGFPNSHRGHGDITPPPPQTNVLHRRPINSSNPSLWPRSLKPKLASNPATSRSIPRVWTGPCPMQMRLPRKTWSLAVCSTDCGSQRLSLLPLSFRFGEFGLMRHDLPLGTVGSRRLADLGCALRIQLGHLLLRLGNELAARAADVAAPEANLISCWATSGWTGDTHEGLAPNLRGHPTTVIPCVALRDVLPGSAKRTRRAHQQHDVCSPKCLSQIGLKTK